MYYIILGLFITWSMVGITSVSSAAGMFDKQPVADVIYLCGDFKLILMSGPIVWVIYWYKAYRNNIKININME